MPRAADCVCSRLPEDERNTYEFNDIDDNGDIDNNNNSDINILFDDNNSNNNKNNENNERAVV